MLNTKALLNSSRAVRAVTGFNAEEIQRLESVFEAEERSLAIARVQAQVESGERERLPGAGKKPYMATTLERLVFILVYFRAYPTQDLLGVLFGMGQSAANKWVHRLWPVLEKTLGRELVLPSRPGFSTLEGLVHACPELVYAIDATERPICRPSDPDRQKGTYSGKKKRHSLKNTLMVSQRTRRVLSLGNTASGRVHDKRLIDEDGFKLPEGSVCFQDSGYTGFALPGVVHLMPKKKPIGGKLSAREKRSNRVLSGARVAVEHSISGVKRSRIVHDTYRNRRPGFDDKAMLISCGLHNLRLDLRARRTR
jgi:hypothetical protein